MLISAGLVVTSLTAVGPPPLGVVHVPLGDHEYLRVLYGANGAGKSTVLAALHDALSGVARGDALYLNVEVRENPLGWDASLLRDLSKAARAAVLSRPAGGNVEVNYLAGLVPADEVDLEDVAALAGLVDQLRHDLFLLIDDQPELAPLVSGPQSLQLSMRAVGTRERPAWDLYVAAVPAPGGEWAERIRGFAPSVSEAMLSTFRAIKFDEIEALTPQAAWSFWVWRLLVRRPEAPPDWVPVPLLRFGRLDRTPDHIAVLFPDGDPVAAAAGSLRALSETRSFARWVGDDLELNPDLLEEMEMMSSSATSIITHLLGQHFEVEIAFTDPATWHSSPTLEWLHVDRARNLKVSLHNLSAAQRRWAAIGIDIATARHGLDLPVVLILDEPERSLHPAAVEQLAESLKDSYGHDLANENVLVSPVVATHAPAFLNSADIRFHVVRRSDGTIDLRAIEFDSLDRPEDLAAELGCTVADLLNMVTRWVIVEGEHDAALVKTVFATTLRERRWQVFAMRGARNAAAAVNSRFLLDFSRADICIVLDHIGDTAMELWFAAHSAGLEGRTSEATRLLEQLADHPGNEIRYLSEAAKEALGRNQLHRIRAVGLEKPDILAYLDPADLGLLASWEDLRREFARTHRGPKSGSDWKKWLRDRGAKINTGSIERAARRMQHLGDLTKILDA
jgi:energy-coupling factor transporter ATP-binding protein EcfA2